MKNHSVMIIGAGASGLAAARKLSRAGVQTTILEARNRPGGRIHTISSHPGAVPVELGAEFVHGSRNPSWKLIREARLKTFEVPDRHWIAREGKLGECKEFWEELSEVTSEIQTSGADLDFASFLAKTSAQDTAKWLMREFVEGFHAAPVGQMSTTALAKSEQAAEKSEGTRAFKLESGYASLVQWLLDEIKTTPILYQTEAKTIRWNKGAVQVEARSPQGRQHFQADKVLVTVPLAILKRKTDGLRFDPPLEQKQSAIDSLAVGQVIKIGLQFHSRFWPVENFGFIHSADKWLPTWWVDERALLLTGWAGGTRAQALNAESSESILHEAVRALSVIFNVDGSHVRDLLAASYFHNWNQDPFACGAYAFTPQDSGAMPALLAEPVGGTIFFAGEATDGDGDQGTVHAAIAKWRTSRPRDSPISNLNPLATDCRFH